MLLRRFSFPLPETRYFRARGLVYKFRIRACSRYSNGQDLSHGPHLQNEMEEIIRVALENAENLCPFSSSHFHVLPSRRPWDGASFIHGREVLSTYPYVISLLLETHGWARNRTESNLPHTMDALSRPDSQEPKRVRTELPLEDSALQTLLEAEARLPCHVMGGHVTRNGRTAGPARHQRGSQDMPGSPEADSQEEAACTEHQDDPALSQVHSGALEREGTTGDESGSRRPTPGTGVTDPPGQASLLRYCVLQ